ncbi:PREDICTED: uncharacterized protein LOC106746660 [Dinoponera quadriceps]|uniref:Uncharacterized protein LOC106746660 n=1 Tax=Dinoponera quadriceps TaxID=609295 RepID=A0A6P3XKZ5_DINQU|nr:PREDICTED: uncharacterized protein LOC106746660 [Dinoponera quadriceps]
MLMAYMKHICGMFRIASYRIEQALPNDITRKISVKNETTIYKEIICAVDIHRKAMKLIFQIVSFGGNTEEFLLHCIYSIAIFMYMLLGNYFGQEMMDHSNHVFLTIYNIQWYITPLHIQKIILFMLQRGSKTCSMNIGGLFIASLENFSTLFSTSISYFTVLYSTQK